MESISGRVSPYLKPGIRASRPSRMVSRIVSSLSSTISLYKAGPYRFATTVGGVWQTAHRCWEIRRPSFCVSVNAPFGWACCARRGGEIIEKKLDTPMKNRILRTTEASLHRDGWVRRFGLSFTVRLGFKNRFNLWWKFMRIALAMSRRFSPPCRQRAWKNFLCYNRRINHAKRLVRLLRDGSRQEQPMLYEIQHRQAAFRYILGQPDIPLPDLACQRSGRKIVLNHPEDCENCLVWIDGP